MVVQKKMIYFLLDFKFYLFLDTTFITKQMSGMNRKQSRREQPNTALPVGRLFVIITKCKNMLNMGYIYHGKKNLFQNKLR